MRKGNSLAGLSVHETLSGGAVVLETRFAECVIVECEIKPLHPVSLLSKYTEQREHLKTKNTESKFPIGGI